MNARWFDRIIYGGAWKQIRFLIIIVVSLIVLSCLGVHWGSKYQMTPSEEMTVLLLTLRRTILFRRPCGMYTITLLIRAT